MMDHGSRAGMLLARCDVNDALVVCLAVGGDDILIAGPAACGRWPAAGIRVGLIGSGRLAAGFGAARRNGHYRQRPSSFSTGPAPNCASCLTRQQAAAPAAQPARHTAQALKTHTCGKQG
jgi:hypothetical protein